MEDFIFKFIEKYHPKIHNGEIFIYDDGYKLASTEFTTYIFEEDLYISELKFKKLLISCLTEVKEETDGIIPLKNGLYHIETEKVIPFSPSFFFFKEKVLPFEFDESKDCPKFKKFLDDILPDKRYQEIILDFMAYTLLKGNFLQKALILVGRGANGKSTFLTFFSRFLNNAVGGVSLQELEKNKFSLFHLIEKYANIYADIPKTEITTSSTFKSITGGDFIKIEQKFVQKMFEVRPSFKLIFSANLLPRFHDVDFAVFRRLFIVPFERTFEIVPDFIDNLATTEEFQGVFNLLKSRFKKLKTSGFSINQNIEEIRQLYFELSDPATQFFSEELIADEEGVESFDEIYNSFSVFCIKNFKFTTQAKHVFFSKLRWFAQKNNLIEFLTDGRRFLKGIKLRKKLVREHGLTEKDMMIIEKARQEITRLKEKGFILTDEIYKAFAKRVLEDLSVVKSEEIFNYVFSFLKNK